MQIYLIYFVLIIIFIPDNRYCQIKIHKSLTTEDGLVSNRITNIFEDSNGYIWFATSNGASRWDGKNFKNYYTINGLAGSQVFDIKEGPDGTIYFANYGKGLTALKNDSIYVINEKDGLPSNWITKILVRLNGDILLAAENGQIGAIRNHQIINWKKEVGFENSSVWSLYETKDSILYLGSNKLFKYKDDKFSDYSHRDSYIANPSYQVIYAIEEDLEGNLFIGTLNGIYKFEKDSLIKIKVNGQPYNNSAVFIKTASNGNTYFCSDSGVLLKKHNSFEFLTKLNGLSDNNIWSVFEDSNSLIYFGTKDQGVNIYSPGKLETYLPEILADQNIISINKDLNNNVYFGTSVGLIINKENTSITKNILRNRTINSIVTDDHNKIYIGTNEGLNVSSSSQISNYSPFEKTSGFNKVWKIIKWTDNQMLIGFQGGLYTLGASGLKKFTSVKGHNQFIQDVILTKDSSLVIGTHGNGVTIYRDGIIKNFSIANSLSDNIINCLHETFDNYILVGTDQGGLNIIQNNIVLKKIDINDGLTSNTIMDINEDSSGNIYLSTAKGINILYNLMDSLFIRTILSSDGLVSNSCNRNATYIDENDIFWIGTNKGLSKYNPANDPPNEISPRIFLTEIEIFNEKYPLSDLRKNHELRYNQNYLKFVFTGINLAAPDKILFRYRLVGVDIDWVTSIINNVQYTSLDDGYYTFEVKARNEWGYWSEPVSLSFIINPAWWETWWFRLILISFIGVLLWLAFQYRLNYLLKLERLRTKIASDLHDEVGSLLTQISINADSLTYTKDIGKINQKSGFIRNKSNEVINMMSDVIWSIDSRNDNLESLIDRIHNFAIKFVEQQNIDLKFNADLDSENKKSLKIDFRQNVMMIAKEAINNAIKYSGSSEIEILIKFKDGRFELRISDNGKGIDFDKIGYGNGLKNMKMRAEAIQGIIEFTNNNGLTVYFTKQKL